MMSSMLKIKSERKNKYIWDEIPAKDIRKDDMKQLNRINESNKEIKSGNVF